MLDSFFLKNGSKIFTDVLERPSVAPFLLAYFASIKGKKRILELCSGSGIVTHWSYDNGFNGKAVLVDKRSAPLNIADMTALENHFDVDTVNCDLKGFRSDNLFDAIICNPPFFDETDVSEDPDKTAIRHEDGLSLTCLFETVRLNIKQKGHFYMCHIPDRLVDIICGLRERELEPKRIRFCRDNVNSRPFLVLLECIYKGGKKIDVDPDLVLRNSDGSFSTDYYSIYGREKI